MKVFDLSDPESPAYRKTKTSKSKSSKMEVADQMLADMEQQFASDNRRQLLEEMLSAGHGARDAVGGVHFADIRAALDYLDMKRVLLDGEIASLLELREHLIGLQNPRDGVINIGGKQVKFTFVDISTTPFRKKAAKKTKSRA